MNNILLALGLFALVQALAVIGMMAWHAFRPVQRPNIVDPSHHNTIERRARIAGAL